MNDAEGEGARHLVGDLGAHVPHEDPEVVLRPLYQSRVPPTATCNHTRKSQGRSCVAVRLTLLRSMAALQGRSAAGDAIAHHFFPAALRDTAGWCCFAPSAPWLANAARTLASCASLLTAVIGKVKIQNRCAEAYGLHCGFCRQSVNMLERRCIR